MSLEHDYLKIYFRIDEKTIDDFYSEFCKTRYDDGAASRLRVRAVEFWGGAFTEWLFDKFDEVCLQTGDDDTAAPVYYTNYFAEQFDEYLEYVVDMRRMTNKVRELESE